MSRRHVCRLLRGRELVIVELLDLGMVRHVVLLPHNRVNGRMTPVLGHLGHGVSNTGRRPASVVTRLRALVVSRPVIGLRQRVRHGTHVVGAYPPINLRLCHIELGREGIVGRVEVVLGLER